jgi:hypothetical protein
MEENEKKGEDFFFIAKSSESRRPGRKKSKMLFSRNGSTIYTVSEPASQVETLPPGIYKPGVHPELGWYLQHMSGGYAFDYKLYGLENALIERVVRTYEATSANLGVLLNGLKGTGKTVTSKVICQRLGLPVVVVDAKLDNVHNFLNSIPQDIIIFLDEYEKTYGDSAEMLTIMDGAMNSDYRRVFLLTTNKLYVDPNLIERPSRIRYLKKFGDLAPAVVEEIVGDMLQHKQYHEAVVQFISTLEVISVDVVRAVVQEVNIHNEPPQNFEDVFNVEKLKGKFNISYKEGAEWKTLEKDVSFSPRPKFNSGNVDNWVQFNGSYVARVTKVLDYNTIVVEPRGEKENQPAWLHNGPMTLRVKETYSYNDTYKYDGDWDGDSEEFIREWNEKHSTKKKKSPPKKKAADAAKEVSNILPGLSG